MNLCNEKFLCLSQIFEIYARLPELIRNIKQITLGQLLNGALAKIASKSVQRITFENLLVESIEIFIHLLDLIHMQCGKWNLVVDTQTQQLGATWFGAEIQVFRLHFLKIYKH